MSSLEVLSSEEVQERAAKLDGWTVEGQQLVREFDCSNFVGSVEFVNKLVPIAEGANHHPDLTISWATVTVMLTTHSAGGLTSADFEVAGRVNSAAYRPS